MAATATAKRERVNEFEFSLYQITRRSDLIADTQLAEAWMQQAAENLRDSRADRGDKTKQYVRDADLDARAARG
jgi:hypothetical protein